MLVLSFLGLKFNLFAFNPWSQVLSIPPTIVLVAMTIYASVEGLLPQAVSLLLKGSVITYLGRRSYALYLIHEPLNVAVHDSRMHGYLSRMPRASCEFIPDDRSCRGVSAAHRTFMATD